MELNTIIFKVDSAGKIREWQTWVEVKDTHATIHTLAGLQDGQKVLTTIDVFEGKNIGRANATTPYEQAVSEAQSKMEKKLRGEYRLELDTASKGELRGGRAPMLAQKFHPLGLESGSKTLAKMGIEHEVVHVQPKLDGLRCIIKVNETSIELRTRGGDLFFPIPHIEEQIRQAYIDFELGGMLEFDGELYTTDFSFSLISGTLRKEKKTPEHLERLKSIKFHVYDVMTVDGYDKRFQLIQNLFGGGKYPAIEIIPSYEIIATDENIDAKMAEFLEAGNEGLMLRTLDMPYDNKRSWQLCKYKFFQDREYILRDIIEDKRGGGIVGKFIMQCNPYIDRDGKEKDWFKAGVKDLTHAEGAEMLANKEEFIGKPATIRFQIFSDYGVPLFPKFVGMRYDL